MKGTVSAGLMRHVLSGAESRGADARVLTREAGLPGWALSDDDMRFPVTQLARLWQLSVAQADLDLPLLRADPVLAAILREQADAELAAPARTPLWIERFRQVLAECVNDRELLLASAARRLMVSRRTLQRLLEQEGTSWRAEVDAARRAQADALLADGLSKTRAATRLGYSDARALRRAVRRWSQP